MAVGGQLERNGELLVVLGLRLVGGGWRADPKRPIECVISTEGLLLSSAAWAPLGCCLGAAV